MTDVIDIYSNFKNKKREKKFVLKFDETEIEVTLEKYLEVTRHGIEKYEYKNNEIVLKPIKKAFQAKPTLFPAQYMGYHFLQNNPHWVEKYDTGGFEWLVE